LGSSFERDDWGARGGGACLKFCFDNFNGARDESGEHSRTPARDKCSEKMRIGRWQCLLRRCRLVNLRRLLLHIQRTIASLCPLLFVFLLSCTGGAAVQRATCQL
jgi:hypothetical protein